MWHLSLGPCILHFESLLYLSPAPHPSKWKLFQALEGVLNLQRLSLLHRTLSHVLHWVSARHTLRLNWIELNWDWDLEAIIEGIYFFLDEKRRQDLIYLYGKLSRAGWYTQMARCSWECEDRVRETEWNRRLRSWHPGANISSGRTQSPPHCACACSSEASAEAEGWCYFDHQAVFSECPWLIPLLLLLMDSILNGKSLLEK